MSELERTVALLYETNAKLIAIGSRLAEAEAKLALNEPALVEARARLAEIESANESKIQDWLDEYAASVMQDIAGTPTGDGMIEFSDRPSRRTNEAREWLLNAFQRRGLRLARLEAALREIAVQPGRECLDEMAYGKCNGRCYEHIARAALEEEK